MHTTHFKLARFWAFIRKDSREAFPSYLRLGIVFYMLMSVVFTWYGLIGRYHITNDLEAVRHGQPHTSHMADLMEKAAQGIDEAWIGISLFSGVFFCLFMIFAGGQFMKESRDKRALAAYLCLPVSNLERYLGSGLRILLLSVVTFYCAAGLAELTRVGITRLSFPEADFSFVMPYDYETDTKVLALLMGTGFQSLFMLGSTYWRKNPTLKTLTACLLLTFLLCATYTLTSESLQPEYFHRDPPGTWGNAWILYILISVTLLTNVLAYIRMKHCGLMPPSWKDKDTMVLLAAILVAVALCIYMPHYIVRHFPYVQYPNHFFQPS